MEEYMKRLLLVQKELAAQFDAAPQPELREVTLPEEMFWQEDGQETAREEKKREQSKTAAASAQSAREETAEARLQALSRQNLQAETLAARLEAKRDLDRTRELERAMTALFERQTVRLTEKTADADSGGLIGSARSQMELAGIASSPSQRSMMEISRFFERDARRYG